MVGMLTTREYFENYCANLPLDVQAVNLSRRVFFTILPEPIQILMSCLKNRSFLTSLDLSHNYLGSEDATDSFSTVAFGEGLGDLQSVTFLDLSHNELGRFDNNHGLKGSISINSISWNILLLEGYARGTRAVGEALGKLQSLTTLNLDMPLENC